MAALEATGWTTATAGNGNLWDWLLMMVLRFQLEARPDLRALSEGYDGWYNQALASRAQVRARSTATWSWPAPAGARRAGGAPARPVERRASDRR